MIELTHHRWTTNELFITHRPHRLLLPGQCYVALSRARTTAGLQIAGFTDSAVKTHPLALAFHDAPTAGTVDAFLVTVPRWFAPVLGEGSRSELACIVCVRQGVKGWKDVADS
jgi:hypothetical protein